MTTLINRLYDCFIRVYGLIFYHSQRAYQTLVPRKAGYKGWIDMYTSRPTFCYATSLGIRLTLALPLHT